MSDGNEARAHLQEKLEQARRLTLTRLGLVKGSRLSPAADGLRRAAILHELAV
jgi:hypothetical protein